MTNVDLVSDLVSILAAEDFTSGRKNVSQLPALSDSFIPPNLCESDGYKELHLTAL